MLEAEGVLLLLVMGAVGIALVIAVGGWERSREQRRRKGLARLAASVNARVSGRTLTGSHGTMDYEAVYQSGEHSAHALTIRVRVPLTGHFVLRREEPDDRLAKRLGYSEELQTDDVQFDRLFYVEAEAEAEGDLAARLGVPEARQAVRDLFLLKGCQKIWGEAGWLSARWEPFDPADASNAFLLVDALPRLASLAGTALPGPSSAPAPAPAVPRLVRAPAATVTSVRASQPVRQPPHRGGVLASLGRHAVRVGVGVVGLFGLVGLVLGRLRWFPLLGADVVDLAFGTLEISLPLFLVFIVVAVRALKGRATSHRELIWAVTTGLIAFPAATATATLLLNQWLDPGPASEHVVVVTSRYSTRDRFGTQYYVSFESWRDPRRTISLRVGEGSHDRAVPRTARLTVVTSPGFLGYERLLAYQVAP
jgi:hypothetical protein